MAKREQGEEERGGGGGGGVGVVESGARPAKNKKHPGGAVGEKTKEAPLHVPTMSPALKMESTLSLPSPRSIMRGIMPTKKAPRNIATQL